MADLPSRAEVDARSTILLIATSHIVSDALIFAIEKEFPWVDVERTERIESMLETFAYPVSLMLIDATRLEEAERLAPELAVRHPEALVALIENESSRPTFPFSRIGRSNLVKGVLPMDFKLDLLLSIVRLMLLGGEYFPRGMLLLHDRPPPTPESLRLFAAERSDRDLTNRETEVLELVSRGLQNKSIAVALGLSEHTVKIHLHNIISKLGAHNRTEAAAWFRDRCGPVLP